MKRNVISNKNQKSTNMRTTTSLVLAFTISFAILSCGRSGLSKDDAMRQITELKISNDRYFPSIRIYQYLPLYSGGDAQGDYILRLKEKGYVDFSTTTAVGNMFQVVNEVNAPRMLDKAKPYLATEGKSFYLKLGDYVPAIAAMTEPSTNAAGTIVCTVEYADSVALNELGKDIGYKSNNAQNKTVQFVKMQDGWKLVSQ